MCCLHEPQVYLQEVIVQYLRRVKPVLDQMEGVPSDVVLLEVRHRPREPVADSLAPVLPDRINGGGGGIQGYAVIHIDSSVVTVSVGGLQ